MCPLQEQYQNMPRKISSLAERALGLRPVGHLSSRVTKGKQVFAALGDGRSAWSRRWADIIALHHGDLGGAARISEAQLSICRRAAALECELEATEARLSEGQQVDLDQYARLTSRLCRLFELIGTRRVTTPPDPLTDLARAFEVRALAIDDDEPPPPLAADLDEPGEA